MEWEYRVGTIRNSHPKDRILPRFEVLMLADMLDTDEL
jgi:hypothetical protein